MPCSSARGKPEYVIVLELHLVVWLALCTHTITVACHHESTTEEGVLAAVHPLAQWSAASVPAGT